MASPGELPLETVVMADVAIVLLVGTALVRLSRRLRQPPVVAEIAAGLMLGPSLLGLLPGDLPDRIFPADARPMLAAIAQLGLLLFMFLAGWEMDLARMRGSARAVSGIATLSVVVPFALGAGVATLLYDAHHGADADVGVFVLFLATEFSITAFPVLARVVRDSRLSGGRVGTMAMACAAVGDVVAWCVLVLVVAMSESSGAGSFLRVVALTTAFALVMALVVRPLLRVLLARRSGRDGYGPSLLAVIASGVLLSAYATSWIGVHAIFGAFVFGLVMPRPTGQPGRRELLTQQIEVPLGRVAALLLPVFFIVAGLTVDLGALGWSGAAAFGLLLTTAVVGKVGATLLPARLSGMAWRDAGAFAVLMNTRGLTDIVILDIGRHLGIISAELFSVMVVVALVTTAMAGPLLHLLGVVRPDARGEAGHPAGAPPHGPAAAAGDTRPAGAAAGVASASRGG